MRRRQAPTPTGGRTARVARSWSTSHSPRCSPGQGPRAAMEGRVKNARRTFQGIWEFLLRGLNGRYGAIYLFMRVTMFQTKTRRNENSE
jgi:hypothetical protein